VSIGIKDGLIALGVTALGGAIIGGAFTRSVDLYGDLAPLAPWSLPGLVAIGYGVKRAGLLRWRPAPQVQGQVNPSPSRAAAPAEEQTAFLIQNRDPTSLPPAEPDDQGLRDLRHAAERGDPIAQGDLGQCYATGNGVPVDNAKALVWYLRASRGGDLVATRLVALTQVRLKRRLTPEQDAQGFAVAKARATAGDPFDLGMFGQLHATGAGVALDYEAAVAWFQRAAARGDDNAKAWLGALFATGRGVPQDDALAVRWYREAAENGHAIAQCDLGRLIEAGRGTERDDAEAARWYRLASAKRPDAKRHLALLLEEGRGEPRQIAESVRFIKDSAEEGDEWSRLRMGEMHEIGYNLAQIPETAVSWYMKAAEGGISEAQMALGRMADAGKGMARDPVVALEWYRRAAEDSYGPALVAIGLAHAEGRGVERDPLGAYLWIDRALPLMPETEREALRETLTALLRELSPAERRALERR
jgi:TPR repeat protein